MFFLNETNIENYYQQLPFNELLYIDDTTSEILKRTCGIQIQPFHKFLNETDIDQQCPIVSLGCI